MRHQRDDRAVGHGDGHLHLTHEVRGRRVEHEFPTGPARGQRVDAEFVFLVTQG